MLTREGKIIYSCCRDRILRFTSICQNMHGKEWLFTFTTSAEAPRSALNNFTCTLGLGKSKKHRTYQASSGHFWTPVYLTIGDDQQHEVEVFEESDNGT